MFLVWDIQKNLVLHLHLFVETAEVIVEGGTFTVKACQIKTSSFPPLPLLFLNLSRLNLRELLCDGASR